MWYSTAKIESQGWITLDSLHFFCRSHDLAITFGSGNFRDLVSPFGIVPQENQDSLEVADRLNRSLNFEICPLDQGKGIRYFLTREELEQQLQAMLN